MRWFALALVVSTAFGFAPSRVAASWAGPSAAMASAESLFAAGEFAAADTAFARVLAASPGDTLALRRRGAIALYQNRLVDARRWLSKALERGPDQRSTRALLAETYYRADDFGETATLYRALGRDNEARRLESFAGRTPYRNDGGTAEVRFVQTDPLPVVEVRVNGSAPAFFIIDTGAAEIILDTAFADTVRAQRFGSDSATYAGGRRGGFEYGRVDSVSLGGLTVRDVPVQILSTRRFGAAAGGRRVDGIIGTVFLYHFLATLDYPGGRLILRPRTQASLLAVEHEAAADSAMVIPFWMSGDHFMVARGRIGQSPPLLWFVDSGLAGGGFTCPAATLADAGIDLSSSPSFDGMGGGGTVKVTPFNVETLSLGPAVRHGITAFFGPFPPALEMGQGYRIAGLISHGFLRTFRLTMDFSGMRYFLR